MKVACPTCDAKYTISDDKVRGKTVKIKCKKCGTSIVAGEEAAAPAAASGPWSLNVGEDDTRSATLAEVAELYRGGVVDDDTYVWREGMPDWAPLSSVDELRRAVAGARQLAEDQPTRMGQIPPEVMRAGKASEPQQAAARRVDAPRGRDLFGAPPAATPSPQPRMIDEEQATTAFDAGAMAARAPIARPAAAPAPAAGPAPKELNESEASGLIDIKLLQNLRSGPPSKPRRDEKLDDLFGVTSSPFDAPAPAPMLMTLDLTAPSPPEPPPPAPPPAPVAAAPAMAAMAPPPQKRSSAGLVIGGLLGVLVLGAAGAGVALVVTKKDDATAAATATPADKADDKPRVDSAPEPAASDRPTASAGAAEAAPTATTVATAAPPEPKDTKPKTAAELKKEAEEKKKREEEAKKKEAEAKKKEAEAKAKEAEAAAPAGGGDGPPFDRAAALSALGGAASAAQSCKTPDGPTGSGRASVTFAPSGRVTQAQIEGAFAGTSVGSCIAAKFRGAKIPAFGGSPVTVKKSFSVN